jgi:hypothetical protein
MITQEMARQAVYDRINAPDPWWPKGQERPEMVIVRVEDHPLGWVFYYDSRPHHETGDFRYAIAGNAPFLVSRDDGTLWSTGTRPPIEDRILEAEKKLRAHLLNSNKLNPN